LTTSSLARLRTAAPATFAVYVCQTLLALAPAWPLARAVERSLATHPLGSDALDAPGGLWRLETLAALSDTAAPLADVTLIAVLLTLAVAPLLQMTWLAALLRRMPLREALALGARRYAAAVGVSVALLPVLLVALGTLALVPAMLSRLVTQTPSDRTHDLVVLGGLVPGLVLLAFWGLWHDLARASLARSGRSLSAVLRGAQACLPPRTLPTYLGWLAVGAFFATAAQLLASGFSGRGSLAAFATLLLTQTLGLARTVVRARWLATALDRVR